MSQENFLYEIKNKIFALILIILIIIVLSFYNLNNISLNKQNKTYKIKVYICGEVENPGVYELNYNSRIQDLLLIAKPKPNADLDTINLAKKLKDEDFIRIYPKNGNNQIKININTASVDEISKLPNISKRTAVNIVEYRQKHGNFTNLSELLKIKGITIEDLETIKNYITF